MVSSVLLEDLLPVEFPVLTTLVLLWSATGAPTQHSTAHQGRGGGGRWQRILRSASNWKSFVRAGVRILYEYLNGTWYSFTAEFFKRTNNSTHDGGNLERTAVNSARDGGYVVICYAVLCCV